MRSKIYEKYLHKQVENYMLSYYTLLKNILSYFQSDFGTDFNAQQCFIGLIEKAQSVMNKGGLSSPLLSALSKMFD